MQIHQLQPKNKNKSRKRVGRGGKRGVYSGRGIKGQGSRAGRKFQPSIREVLKRYPKLKGYRQNPLSKSMAVNLLELEKAFKTGDTITPVLLLKKRLVGKIKNRAPMVKILAKGEITKKFVVDGCAVSESARKKIEKAGGKIINNQ